MSQPTRKKKSRCPGALARNWRLAACVASLIAAAAFVGVMFMPRLYESEARLLVHAGPERTVDSIVATLKSREMLERLAQSLAAPQTIAQLEKSIDVTPVDESNLSIVRIHSRADNSTAAQQTAARLVELCLEQHASPGPAAESQSADPPQHALTTPAQLQGELAGVAELLGANRTQLAAAEARVAAAEERLAKLPEDLPAPKPAESPSLGDLRARLLELEAQERELAATRSELHPLLRAVRQQVADLQSVIGQEPGQSAPVAAASPRQAVENELREAQLQAKALRTRQQSLAALQAKLQGDLETAAAVQPALASGPPSPAAVERPAGAAFSLTLMQPASLPIELTRPRRLQSLALGLLIALAGGFGSAFVAAFFRPVLNTPAELERLLEVPLVGILPRAGGPTTAGV